MTEQLEATSHRDNMMEQLCSTKMVTPAFVVLEHELADRLNRIRQFCDEIGLSLLFSLKSFALVDGLKAISRSVNGFSCSSLFEARLARSVLSRPKTVHLVAPYLTEESTDEMVQICDFVSLNSIGQIDRFRNRLAGRASVGLRVNPELSFVKDRRYDPCRPDSKLGVPIDEMVKVLRRRRDYFELITGIHMHTNCESEDLSELALTIEKVSRRLGDLLGQLHWWNLGGGYVFDQAANLPRFAATIERVRRTFGLRFWVEPGAAIVRESCCLIACVVDLFERGGRHIAVLDTSVNHWPEVFEYQFEPDVVGHVEGGRYQYILAGCSCLAGDLFGEYSFNQPLELGSRVVFANAGAYSLVKAHMFNGINLPTIYVLTEMGELVMKKRFTYDDFASRCGVDSHATV